MNWLVEWWTANISNFVELIVKISDAFKSDFAWKHYLNNLQNSVFQQ